MRVGRQEFNTKCSFDAAAGFEDLLMTLALALALIITLTLTITL